MKDENIVLPEEANEDDLAIVHTKKYTDELKVSDIFNEWWAVLISSDK